MCFSYSLRGGGGGELEHGCILACPFHDHVMKNFAILAFLMFYVSSKENEPRNEFFSKIVQYIITCLLKALALTTYHTITILGWSALFIQLLNITS